MGKVLFSQVSVWQQGEQRRGYPGLLVLGLWSQVLSQGEGVSLVSGPRSFPGVDYPVASGPRYFLEEEGVTQSDPRTGVSPLLPSPLS